MPHADNNGIKIYYKVEGKGTPIVMLHGFEGDIKGWYRISYVDSLKKDYQLILVNLRAHGRSDKPHESEAYTMKLLTSDIIAVMDDLKLEKAHFWGYSMGGHIGFGLTKYYPERFFSFILGGISPQDVEEELQLEIDNYSKAFKGGLDTYLSYYKKSGVEITTEMKEEIDNYDFKALYAFFRGDIFHGHEEHLPQLEVPILLYVGEEDGWGHYPRAVECSKIIPNIRLVSFPDQGHGVHSHKDLVLPHVIEFLNELKRA